MLFFGTNPRFCMANKLEINVKMFIFFMLLQQGAFSQAIPADSMFSLIKQYNAYGAGADWASIDKQFHQSLISAQNSDDTIQSLIHVFATLDDVHTTFQINGKTYGFYHGVTADESAQLQPLMQRQREESGKIFTTKLPGDIAYIRIPTLNIWGDDIHTYTKTIQDSLLNILDKTTIGCIVDLRLNGGGNMYPMLAGLYPLLGNNTVMHITNPDSTVATTWFLKKGNLYAENIYGDKVPVTNVDYNSKENYDNLKVTVLIGPVTMSSGQATAVAFYKRKNTLFIGEPSATGYATAKNYYPLPNNCFMNMSSGFISDREGELYPQVVNPQLWVIHGDNFDKLSEDLKVQMSTWRLTDK